MDKTALNNKLTGATLLETMIALAIGLVIIMAIGYIYLGSSSVFKSLNASTRMQENIRYVFEKITNETRMAGFTGCSTVTTSNILNNSSDWYKNLFNKPLIGYEETTIPLPTEWESKRLTGDSLSLLKVDNSNEYSISSHNTNARTFTLNTNSDLQSGDIVVATDCNHATLFQISNISAQTIDYTPIGNSPGNCTAGLGSPLLCTPTGNSYEFSAGSKIFKMSATAFYIGNNESGEKSLYTANLTSKNGSSSFIYEELIDGIEDIDILYGIDTDDNQSVDNYVDASQVAIIAPGSNEEEKWAKVLSIRVSLLAASKSSEKINTQIVPYTFRGITITPNDFRMRKTFTTTITIRNRI